MTERLLQFIWQFQYFNKTELTADSGETIEIIFAGQHNTNQGPDFTNAKIKIDDTIWAGTVELHIKTSDWKKHQHQQDSHYKNVILHVVWEHDGGRNSVPASNNRNESDTELWSTVTTRPRTATQKPAPPYQIALTFRCRSSRPLVVCVVQRRQRLGQRAESSGRYSLY